MRNIDWLGGVEESTSKLPEDWQQQIKAAYPKRYGGYGWADALRLIQSAVARGESFEAILAGTVRYRKYCEASGKIGTELVRQAKTFFGPGRWWAEYDDLEEQPADNDFERNRRTIQEWLQETIDARDRSSIKIQ